LSQASSGLPRLDHGLALDHGLVNDVRFWRWLADQVVALEADHIAEVGDLSRLRRRRLRPPLLLLVIVVLFPNFLQGILGLAVGRLKVVLGQAQVFSSLASKLRAAVVEISGGVSDASS